MQSRVRLLIAGSARLHEYVCQLIPWIDCVFQPIDREATAAAGGEQFHAVLISAADAAQPAQYVASIRAAAPDVRIVLACAADSEFDVRSANQFGADEYILEPVCLDELQSALRLWHGQPNPASGIYPMQLAEIYQLADVMEKVDDGPSETLARLAAAMLVAFNARGIWIQVDELAGRAGDDQAADTNLSEPIVRNGKQVGSVTIVGAPSAESKLDVSLRLREYARLIDTSVTLAQRLKHWRELAWRDDLSGLRNRRFFEQSLDQLVAKALLDRTRLTVLLFDIDNFKDYNDRYGHATGDELVREIAFLLRRCSRENDVVARYGGDEFGVILWDAENPRTAGSQHPTTPTQLAQRFRETIESHQFNCLGNAAAAPVTISGGLASLPWDGTTRSELMHAADLALMEAKSFGKNHIVLATGERDKKPPG